MIVTLVVYNVVVKCGGRHVLASVDYLKLS
jgi:hypothetical protein